MIKVSKEIGESIEVAGLEEISASAVAKFPSSREGGGLVEFAQLPKTTYVDVQSVKNGLSYLTVGPIMDSLRMYVEDSSLSGACPTNNILGHIDTIIGPLKDIEMIGDV